MKKKISYLLFDDIRVVSLFIWLFIKLIILKI